MGANEDSKSAWVAYQSRETMFWVGFFLLVGSVPALFFFQSFSGLIVVSGALGFALTVPLVYWKCPACGKRFFRRWWAFDNDYKTMFNPFRKKCAHCGLRKWKEPELKD